MDDGGKKGRSGGIFGHSLRQPPANLQAEQALLGAILANNKAYAAVSEFLRPEHFSDAGHAAIYQQCVNGIEAGTTVDAVTLHNWWQGRMLDWWPGQAHEDAGRYLGHLITAMVGIINARDYGMAILEAARRRTLIAIGEELVNGAYAIEPPADALAGAASAKLDAALAGNLGKQAATLGQGAQAAFERADAAHRGDQSVQAFFTGIPVLDALWDGSYPSGLDILGARSNVGKSALAMQIARYNARLARDMPKAVQHGRSVHVFSLEMTALDLGAVSLAAATGISASDIRRGNIGGTRAGDLLRAQQELDTLPLTVDDTAGINLIELRARARAARRRGAGLFIIDHRDLIQRDPEYRRSSVMEWLAYLGQQLKVMAKQLDAAVILLVQLSRDIERREDSTPRKSDLMYTNEADADNIILLHRPGLGPVASAYKVKGRFGPLGDVILSYDGPRLTFGGPAPAQHPAPPSTDLLRRWGDDS